MATHRPVPTLQEFRNQCNAARSRMATHRPVPTLHAFRSQIGPSLDGRHQLPSCNFPPDGNPEWGGLAEWGNPPLQGIDKVSSVEPQWRLIPTSVESEDDRSRGKRSRRGQSSLGRHKKRRRTGPLAWKIVLEEAQLTEKELAGLIGGQRPLAHLKQGLMAEAIAKNKTQGDHDEAAALAVNLLQ